MDTLTSGMRRSARQLINDEDSIYRNSNMIPKTLSKGALIPVKQALGPEASESKKVMQTIELCQVVDKKKTGKVSIQNFLRIS